MHESGSAWTWNEERKQFYLHHCYAKQPDLKLRNELVKKEIQVNSTFAYNHSTLNSNHITAQFLFNFSGNNSVLVGKGYIRISSRCTNDIHGRRTTS